MRGSLLLITRVGESTHGDAIRRDSDLRFPAHVTAGRQVCRGPRARSSAGCGCRPADWWKAGSNRPSCRIGGGGGGGRAAGSVNVRLKQRSARDNVEPLDLTLDRGTAALFKSPTGTPFGLDHLKLTFKFQGRNFRL